MKAIMDALISEAKGRCVACGESLPKRGQAMGRPKTVCCGSRECWAAYHELRRSRLRELAMIGLQVELKRKAKAARVSGRSDG